MNITITDTLLNGTVTNEVQIDFKTEHVTVEQIITERVKSEVEAYNRKQPEYFKGLVEPLDAEKTLNGYKVKKNQPIDIEKQVYVALNAFQKNGFFVLIDNIQAEELNQHIFLKSNTTISFLKLTQLVGG
jgi:hypothetical protein